MLIGNDEVICYSENSPVPHITKGLDYSLDTQLRRIDEHKFMVPKGPLNRGLQVIRTGQKAWGQIAPYFGLLVAGVIVVLAFTGVI